MRERVQKIIARAGLTSRRGAERLIEDGLVTVNGKVVRLGDHADAERDHIKVKGKLLHRPEKKAYFLFNKPRGVLTSAQEGADRPTVGDFFSRLPMRLFPVGRLDLDSEGLLILTNDGDLAHGLMHPKGQIPKTYRVKVKGVPPEKALQLLRRGVTLEDGPTRPAEVELMETTATNAWLNVTIHEGKNRQVRRMFEAIHHSVLKLKRTRYAFLSIGHLAPGDSRPLTPREVERLKKLANTAAGTPSMPAARNKKSPARPNRIRPEERPTPTPGRRARARQANKSRRRS